MKSFYFIFISLLITQYCDIFNGDNKIVLPDPEKKGGMPLNEALSKRKSSRDFDPSTELTPEIISQALWCCYGPNRENGHKTTPSANAWYPLIVYVFLEEGVYQYEPNDNTLTKLLSGDFRAMTGSQTSIVTKASVNFVFIGDLKKPTKYEGETKLIAIYSDTGHCSMALGLFASANNMKGVTREMVDVDPLLELLGLPKEDYMFALSFSLGY